MRWPNSQCLRPQLAGSQRLRKVQAQLLERPCGAEPEVARTTMAVTLQRAA